MTRCKECYAEENRITPLLREEDCLQNHEQYICGVCGRCICIGKDEKRNVQRWNFPFKSLEIAKLYLRTADFTMKKPCESMRYLILQEENHIKYLLVLKSYKAILKRIKIKLVT